jgi:5-methylcytosine-specific restriction endonuclease McrA
MANEIIPYLEMCSRERASLQRGMNFGLGNRYSVILMSVRPNAPYADRFENDGSTLVYEGHDCLRTRETPDPKRVDQPELTPAGTLTQNGKFLRAALSFKNKHAPPHNVKVYEKINQGIWSYNGVFHLIDVWREKDQLRTVFKFKLIAVEGDEPEESTADKQRERRRIVPTSVKLEVWKRDNGRCVLCGATDELHFDHDLPYSRGGTSMKVENVQLLCARHNLSKGAKII